MTATKTRRPTLMQRLSAICSQHGWQCGLVRVLSDASQSPRNTAQTCAKMNSVAVWHDERVVQLGMIADVKAWSDEQVVAKLKEMESQG